MFLPVLLLFTLYVVSESRQFSNPVLTGVDSSRPSVIYVSGTYYMVTSNLNSDGTAWFPIHSSTNLESWLRIGTVFTTSNFPPWVTANSQLSSPVLHYNEIEGAFYVFFNAIPRGGTTSKIGVATSKSILQPFVPGSDPIDLKTGANEGDVAIIQENDQGYLLWSGPAVGGVGILAKRFNFATMSVGNDESMLLLYPNLSWELGGISAPTHFYRNGYHYILYNNAAGCSGVLRDQSAIGVARSTSILGPYTKMDGYLMSSTTSSVWGTGYGTILADEAGGDVLIYGGIATNSDSCEPPQIYARNIFYDTLYWPRCCSP